MARTAPLLDLEPRLADGMSVAAAAEARRLLAVSVLHVPAGPWQPPEADGLGGLLGLMVVDGLLERRLLVQGGTAVELLSQGDILRPWDESETSFSAAQWRALTDVTLAALDRAILAGAARWPGLVDGLLAAMVRRARNLAVQSAIRNVIGLRQRLYLIFWHLAERWGSVEPAGVSLPLHLSHRVLADLVGARRPSVTTAIGALEREGMVSRRQDGTWFLHGQPPPPEELAS